MDEMRCYGWVPDLPDRRDFRYAVPRAVIGSLPENIDLRPNCPVVYDQGRLGSCTAQSIGAAHQFNQIKQAIPNFIPSRLMIYYEERVMENSVESDCGAMIRDGMKVVANIGACPETMWTYDISKFAQKPPDNCYTESLLHQVTSYLRVDQNLDQLRGCLAEGYPFVFGFMVYEKFQSSEVARTGIANMPGISERRMGGHAVMVVGYNDATQRFIVRNSWGSGWGQSGYFTMPYSYLTDQDLSADFWTIRNVET